MSNASEGKKVGKEFYEKNIPCFQDTVKGLIDYKFYCFCGVPKFLYVSKGLENHQTAKISYITIEWKKAPFYRKDYVQFDALPPKPKQYECMIQLAEKLAKNIPFLRVDFYEIDGQIYFSEFTFHPSSGLSVFEPEKWDKKLGNLIHLPKKVRKVVNGCLL